MTGRPGATAGVLIAGLTAIAALVAWPVPETGAPGILAVAGAAVATGAFSAGRHGQLSTRWTGLAAVGGGLLALVGVVVGLIGWSAGGAVGGIIAALGAGVGAVATLTTGLAVLRDIPPAHLVAGGRRVGIAAAVGLLGLYVASFVAITAESLLETAAPGTGPLGGFAARQIGMGVGFVGAAMAFLLLTDRGIGYIDLERPDRHDLTYVGGGILGIVAVGALIVVIYTVADVATTEHVLLRRGREQGAAVILLAIPFTWIGAAVGEEVFYRNVVQKYLSERLSSVTAVLASSAIFAGIHVPAYTPGTVGTIAAPILAIFLTATVLAICYERTGNVLVSFLVHGSYNVLVYGWVYLQLT